MAQPRTPSIIDEVFGPRLDSEENVVEWEEPGTLETRPIPIATTRVQLKVMVDAEIFRFYEIAKAKGFNGDIGAWIMDVVRTLYRKYGYTLVLVYNKDQAEWAEKKAEQTMMVIR